MYAQDDSIIIRWHGTVALHCPPPAEYYVYLLHFDEKIGNPSKARGMAGHYLGFTGNLEARLHLHRSGNGAAIMTALGEAGIGFTVARLWKLDSWLDGRLLERRLKRRHEGPRLCPICQHRQFDAYTLLYQGHWPFSLFSQPGKRQPLRETFPHFRETRVSAK